YSALPAMLTAALIGACAGGRPADLTRARVFMRAPGSLLLGLLPPARTSALAGPVDPARAPGADLLGPCMATRRPSGVLLVPLPGVARAVLRRTGAGKSPFHADKAHLHHRLLSIGHSKLTAVLIMYTWPVVISVGLLLPLVLPMRSVYLFWVLGLMFAVLLTFDPLRWRPGRHRKDSDAHSA